MFTSKSAAVRRYYGVFAARPHLPPRPRINVQPDTPVGRLPSGSVRDVFGPNRHPDQATHVRPQQPFECRFRNRDLVAVDDLWRRQAFDQGERLRGERPRRGHGPKLGRWWSVVPGPRERPPAAEPLKDLSRRRPPGSPRQRLVVQHEAVRRSRLDQPGRSAVFRRAIRHPDAHHHKCESHNRKDPTSPRPGRDGRRRG